ncbi:hypothetical protein LEP1GSC193_2703 [Leptospira alstonii serovar Pingchang str. 80-412]|uniref:Uncharacterized protein n=2 Tax=Leptospira alstonii TaxID=28452 RepID=M6D6G9_9LEPT|nr:hypothetical protein LEP1GSC194_0157 [Leptospira alstonii serovar Sichuan str. 79601]EQA79162.1 hypothetical protein LEP1GSC193_2703 [Leptospira alstonii serovar Pingchang str. 80-412]
MFDKKLKSKSNDHGSPLSYVKKNPYGLSLEDRGNGFRFCRAAFGADDKTNSFEKGWTYRCACSLIDS